jgi:RHS repeat-associated protein
MTRRFLLGALLLGSLPALAWSQTTVVEYYHLDALGTVRAMTNQAGAVVERHDYLPYGEEWCGTAVCSSPTQRQPLRFTGKERDAETGLDYFGARYYGSKAGRFTTTDPVYTWEENLVDPQRWNRYAYARNNPLKFVDPDGRNPARALEIGRGVTDFAQHPLQYVKSFLLGAVKAETNTIRENVGLDPVTYSNDVERAGGATLEATRDTAVAVAPFFSKGGTVEKTASGARVGDFTRAQRNAAKAENAAANRGTMACEGCGLSLENIANQKGVPTPANQAQVHHDPPLYQGGSRDSTPVVLCPECHKQSHP